jgi:hypothetical protein
MKGRFVLNIKITFSREMSRQIIGKEDVLMLMCVENNVSNIKQRED